MRKATTTKKINEAITNGLLIIEKTEVHYKTSGRTETIDTDKFHENFSFLCETGVFTDCIGWHYEWDRNTNGYIVETGRMNPDSEIIISVCLSVCNGACKENVEKALEVTERNE